MRASVPGSYLLTVLLITLMGLTGCDEWSDDAEVDGSVVLTIQIEQLPWDPLAQLPAASLLSAAPAEVSVYVGDQLFLEFELTDPEAGDLRADEVPPASYFTAFEGGGELLWSPVLSDVGQHSLYFEVVAKDDPELVLEQVTVLVLVIPRFGFIEYGF